MLKTTDNPATVPAPAGPYSHVVRLEVGGGALLFVSGQVALDERRELVGPGDMAAQARHVMDALGKILAAHGASYDDVVNIRSYLTDMGRRAEYGAVRAEYIKGEPPSSTTVEVSRLFVPGALLEVELIAAVG
ncbi:RidA family protein [Streptomyces boninensis]|uniref:RidA family protein n=1 Tax=Streptomyces boninensis TaxID=2039455 RepID=UPI003B2199F8